MDTDAIITQLEEFVEKKIQLAPAYWLEQAQKLAVLSSDETDLLHKLQKEVAQEKVKWIELGKSVAEAKIRTEAEDVYQIMQKQKAKCDKVTEIIRIAKSQARLRSDEMFNNL